MSLAFLVLPEVHPFAVAFGIGIGLCLIEIVTFFFGVPMSDMVEGWFDFGGGDVDVDTGGGTEPGATGWIAGLFGFLNPHQVPFSMWLILAFLGYAGVGLIGQGVLSSAGLPMLPAWVAGWAALPAALPVVRVLSQGLGRILPKDHSEAVSKRDLIGRIGTVTIGPARSSAPGRAYVTDQFNTGHNVRIVPFHEQEKFDIGVEVLLVDLMNDDVFTVVDVPTELYD